MNPMNEKIEQVATLILSCPKCGTTRTIPLSTEDIILEQNLVTVRIDKDKMIEDIINNHYDDEPGAVKQRQITLTATVENTLEGLTCMCVLRRT